MNQELYGPPTNLPWGIAIECQNRVAQYHCPGWEGTGAGSPVNAHFIPLFFYESVLSLIGIFVMLFLWRQFTAKGRLLIAGDVGLLYFVWYGIERSGLETLRGGWDWTFFGIPMAQLVGLSAAAAAIVAIVIRHAWVRRHPAAPVAVVDGGPTESGPTEPTLAGETTEPAAPTEPAPPAAPTPAVEPAPAASEESATAAVPITAEAPAGRPSIAARLAGLFGRKDGRVEKPVEASAEPEATTPAPAVEPPAQPTKDEPAAPAE
jgi:hypothetical protein